MIYLATPFTDYYLGHRAAFLEASRLAGALAAQGRHVFCPIVHGYPLALYGGLPLVDVALWERINAPYLDAASELYIAMMDGWKKSEGIEGERRAFEQTGRPIYFLNPNNMRICKQ